VDPGVVDGFVVVLGVVVVDDWVLAVLLVDWIVVPVVELGAAAAPAMPATAPPVARAPTTRPTRIMPLLFIREPPVVGAVTLTILRPLPKAIGTCA
jgi:hypothetical protein